MSDAQQSDKPKGISIAAFAYFPIALTAIAVALYSLYRFGSANIPPPANMPDGFNGTFRTLVELPIPFTNYLFPVYPYSLIMLGIFLIFLTFKFGWRALPILIMAAGAFDLTEKQNLFGRIFTDSFWLGVQLTFFLVGWLIAGRPGLRIRYGYFVLVLITLLLFGQSQYYDFYEAALYLFIYKCTTFQRSLPQSQSPSGASSPLPYQASSATLPP